MTSTDMPHTRYLLDNLSLSESAELFANHLPPDVRAELTSHDVTNIALGQPVRLLPDPTLPQRKRIAQVLDQLHSHPEVAAALAGLREHWNTLVPSGSNADASDADRAALWTVAQEAAGYLVVRNTQLDDIVAYLFWSAMSNGTSEDGADSPFLHWLLKGSRPLIWINLADRPVTVVIPPGRILADVTFSAAKDMENAWPTIALKQRQFGHNRPTGGRHDDPLRMKVVHSLYEMETGRGSRLSWRVITERFNKKFGLDLHSSVLNKQYRDWRKRNGLGPCDRRSSRATESES
jgi:hypothetical protein